MQKLPLSSPAGHFLLVRSASHKNGKGANSGMNAAIGLICAALLLLAACGADPKSATNSSVTPHGQEDDYAPRTHPGKLGIPEDAARSDEFLTKPKATSHGKYPADRYTPRQRPSSGQMGPAASEEDGINGSFEP